VGASAQATKAKKTGIRRWITPALAVVAAIAVGLVGGVLIGKNTANSARAGGPNGAAGAFAGANGTAGGAAGGGFTSGTIVSVKDGKLVIKTSDGTEKTVTTGDSTTVTATSDADLSDLKKGDTVRVVGSTGDDGSVTATSISEGDTGFGGGGAPGGAPTSAPSN
jgi:hypothetical protein